MNEYVTVTTAAAAAPVIRKICGVLAAAEIFTVGTTLQVVHRKSIRLDSGYAVGGYISEPRQRRMPRIQPFHPSLCDPSISMAFLNKAAATGDFLDVASPPPPAKEMSTPPTKRLPRKDAGSCPNQQVTPALR